MFNGRCLARLDVRDQIVDLGAIQRPFDSQDSRKPNNRIS
jgi:hypothetical protein